FTDAYLKQVDKVCFQHSNAWGAMPNYYVGADVKKADGRMAQASKRFSAFVTDFEAVKAPKKWRAFRSAAVGDLKTIDNAAVAFSAALTTKTSTATFSSGLTTFANKIDAADKRATKRFNKQSLFRCGSDF